LVIFAAGLAVLQLLYLDRLAIRTGWPGTVPDRPAGPGGAGSGTLAVG
jgi:hypothetical protein